MRIDTREALQYVIQNFNISGEATRMVDNLFQHVSTNQTTNARKLILDVLDGIGFEESDLDDMAKKKIIEFDPDEPTTRNDLNEIVKLQEFLMSDGNEIIIKVQPKARLALSMDKLGRVFARIFESPIRTAPATKEERFLYNDGALSIPDWISIIQQIKEQPGTNNPSISRWSEIYT